MVMTQSSQLYQEGRELAMQLFGDPDGDLTGTPISSDDDFKKEMVSWVFGYLLKERSLVPVKTKVLAIIAMCAASGQYDMLRRWLVAAKNSGSTRIEVQEAILTMAMYGGWPRSREALTVFAEAWPSEK
jgi:4-carboxymuconolactone decarboxylase